MSSRTFSLVTAKLMAFLFTAVLFGAAMLAATRPGAAQASHTTDTFVEPFDIIVSAADGCSGEDVHVFGNILDTIQTTIDANGGEHISMQFVPDLQGIGESTGLVYLPKGPAHVASLVAPSGTTVFGVTNVTRLVAPGSTPNLVVTEHVHVTINPNGTVTVDRDYVTAACRG